MNKDVYLIKNGKWVKATKWMLFKNKLKRESKRWKIVDTFSNKIIPLDNMKRYFSLSPQEYEDAEKIYKEKGTIAYIFYPCGGIAWGIKVRVLDTDEEIDITDVTCW